MPLKVSWVCLGLQIQMRHNKSSISWCIVALSLEPLFTEFEVQATQWANMMIINHKSLLNWVEYERNLLFGVAIFSPRAANSKSDSIYGEDFMSRFCYLFVPSLVIPFGF
eukprot:TRINITY_DN8433_c1_g2_i1.p1 TRINITY_DN8433_c1_g2~~TRINITY_DN8433_c1_g2_i1.p1  ORF type:complete len:110 (-),score=14.95 TRINITY_DN8433_c1_g2_i1:505-834(-)